MSNIDNDNIRKSKSLDPIVNLRDGRHWQMKNNNIFHKIWIFQAKNGPGMEYVWQTGEDLRRTQQTFKSYSNVRIDKVVVIHWRSKERSTFHFSITYLGEGVGYRRERLFF